LLNELGLSVEVINYRRARASLRETAILYAKGDLKKILYNLKKKRRIDEAVSKLPLHPRITTQNKRKIPYYDSIVIGSDIVWNIERAKKQNDYTFFGEGLKTDNLVAFSASGGKSESLALIPKKIQFLTNQFSMVSVRDRPTGEMVSSIRAAPMRLPDPTFSINWNSITENPNISNYCLIYANRLTHSQIETIKDFAMRRSLQLIAVGYYQNWCKNLAAPTPTRWISYFKHASFVFTSTFHGSVFATYFSRPFLVFNNPGINEKVQDLLQDSGSEWRLIKRTDQLVKLPNEATGTEDVQYLCSINRDSSNLAKSFLKEALL